MPMTNNTSISATEVAENLSRSEETLLVAVLRELDPLSGDELVFSKVASKISALCGQRYFDLVGEKPVEFSVRYSGSALIFSRDKCVPPLLWVRRTRGPWTPIPLATEAVRRWASHNAHLEFRDVDFAAAVREHGCDRDVPIIEWLKARGEYRKVTTTASTMESSFSRTSSMRDPNAASSPVGIGKIYKARVSRVAHKSEGLVCELLDSSVDGTTAFLPSGALPSGTSIEALLGEEILVKVVGRKGPSILLNLASADHPHFSLQGLSEVLKSIERIQNDAAGLHEVLSSLQQKGQDVKTAVPMAEALLQRGVAQVLRHALKAWWCRGGTQAANGLLASGKIPSELIAIKDDYTVPYTQVAAAISAL